MNVQSRPTAVEVRGLSKNFQGLEVLQDVTTAVPMGEVRAIIGPNGAGKTTLINLLTGVHPASAGSIFLAGTEITNLPAYKIARKGLARTFQIANLFTELSVRENVAVANYAARRFGTTLDDSDHRRLAARPGDGTPRCDDDVVDASLELVGLADLARRNVSEISHGDQKLLEIAIATAFEPVVLLLDEPTAGMSPSETSRFIDLLNERLRSRCTIVVVEHDMHVVMNTADVISVLVMGRILAEAPPSAIKGNRKVQEAYLGGTYA